MSIASELATLASEFSELPGGDNKNYGIKNRSFAELGTAAGATLTTGASDTTAGRVLKVGDFGLGGQVGGDVSPSTLTATQFFQTFNSANMPSLSTWTGLHIERDNGGRAIQTAWEDSTNKQFHRIRNSSSVWGNWFESYDTNNVSPYIQTLLNDPDSTTARTTLGTVSKSGDTFTGNVVVPSLNGGQLAGMRNKIINGKMEISQRGTSFTSITNGTYLLDRFFTSYTTTAGFTVAQSTSIIPANSEFGSSLALTVTGADTSIASGDYCLLAQSIEGYNIRDLVGKTFTVSFWVRSAKTGAHCVALRDAGGAVDRSYIAEVIINAANTWEYKTFTVTGGLPTSGNWNYTNGGGLVLTFVLAAGSTYHTVAGAWQAGNFLSTASQVNCLDTVGNIFAITGVQLEVGSVATPFEHRPYGQELALCQRYYYQLSSTVSTAGIGASSANWSAAILSHPVKMRVAPTITFTDMNGLAGQVDFRSGNGVLLTRGVPQFVSASVDLFEISDVSANKSFFTFTNLKATGAEL